MLILHRYRTYICPCLPWLGWWFPTCEIFHHLLRLWYTFRCRIVAIKNMYNMIPNPGYKIVVSSLKYHWFIKTIFVDILLSATYITLEGPFCFTTRPSEFARKGHLLVLTLLGELICQGLFPFLYQNLSKFVNAWFRHCFVIKGVMV